MRQQKGFTLVEMGAVMIVIGLLSAGVLTGMKLLQNAKVAATTVQIQNYSAAVTAFEKTYKGLPGDLPNAHKKIRGCQSKPGFAGCELVAGGGAVTTDVCKPAFAPGCAGSLSTYCASATASATVINTCNTVLLPSSPPLSFGPDLSACVLAVGGYHYTDAAVCTTANKYTYYDQVTTQVAVTGMMGDGAVGAVSWDMVTFRGDAAGAITGANAVDFETVLFWYELKQAGLIGGVTDAGLRAGSKPQFGHTHPAAEVGGGFWAAYSDGTYGGEIGGVSGFDVHTGRPRAAGDYDLYGNILVLVKIPTGSKTTKTISDPVSGQVIADNIYAVTNTNDSNLLTPEMAASMDIKLDDGLPTSGIVQAFGTGACYGNSNAPFYYDTRESNRDCGLYIRIK